MHVQYRCRFFPIIFPLQQTAYEDTEPVGALGGCSICFFDPSKHKHSDPEISTWVRRLGLILLCLLLVAVQCLAFDLVRSTSWQQSKQQHLVLCGQ